MEPNSCHRTSFLPPFDSVVWSPDIAHPHENWSSHRGPRQCSGSRLGEFIMCFWHRSLYLWACNLCSVCALLYQSELIQAHKMQVRGTVVFDSIAWIGPIAVSTLSACTLLQLEVSDPRLVSKPASRRMRRICEYLGYAYVLGVVGLLFFFISRARISRYWDSRESAFSRWPKINFADLVVKAIAFCLGPAGWMLWPISCTFWCKALSICPVRTIHLSCSSCADLTVCLSSGLLFALGALIPAVRGAPLLAALGVPASESIRAHARLGRISVVCLFGHAFGYIFHWWRRGGLVEAWNATIEWPQFGVSNLAGAIALFGGGGLLAASAYPAIRRRWYRAFYYGHVFGSLVFVIFACAHWTYCVFYFAPATVWHTHSHKQTCVHPLSHTHTYTSTCLYTYVSYVLVYVCMYVLRHIQICVQHICAHTHIYICIHVYLWWVYIYMFISRARARCIYVCMNISVYTCVYIYIYVYTYIHIFIYTYVHIFIYSYIHIYIYIYIYINI